MRDARRTTDYNSAKNNRTVTSKQYALLHIIVILFAKFQLRWIKTVDEVIRKEHAKQETQKFHDGWMDDLPFYVLFNSVSVIPGR